MQEIAKLYAVKPVLGATKAAFLKDLGFVKEGTQWGQARYKAGAARTMG